MHRFLLLVLIAGLTYACNSSTTNKGVPTALQTSLSDDAGSLSDQWYQGKAEISTYTLQQNRYQDTHPGTAVLIFVTEDFLTDKQVKNDNYTNPNSVPVLKTNMLRKFTTGMYDYSTMTSVFTGVNEAFEQGSMKVSTSVQDWCGHAYMQLNLQGRQYQTTVHSYFENEADDRYKFSNVWLEDELFNYLRIDPSLLPTGQFEVAPSTLFARLRHVEMAPTKAEGSLEAYSGDAFQGKDLKIYKLEMPDFQRKLEIVFQGSAPFQIEGWLESYPSAFDKEIRTTVATRQKTIWSPYWEKHSRSDQYLRSKLGI